ncbi:MAG: hypothetical protein LBD32_01970 [Cytophagales bacterium]|jgi:hypothetical protein|nr:hypothetical protein [Cytophagales bacterium]
MYIGSLSKKIFFICFFLSSQSVVKASWESLYEEFEHSDNKNLYLYPIDGNVSYALNYSTRFKTIDKSIQTSNKNEVLFNFDGEKKRNLRGFLNHGFRVDAGVLMTGYGFAKKYFCFPRFGLIYQHLFFDMKLAENGSVDDFIFYFSPVTSPVAIFEVAPRIGFGFSYLSIPREYYSKVRKEEDGSDEQGEPLWKIKNDDPVDYFLYQGFDLAFSYDLIFKLRLVPEWTIFATVGGVWHPLLFRNGLFGGKKESDLEKNSFNEKILKSVKLIDGGLGTMGGTIGFNYNFKPALEKPEWYNKILRREDKKVRFKFEFLGGARHKYNLEKVSEEGTNRQIEVPVENNMDGILGGDFKTLLQFSNFQALGVGIGFVNDLARKFEVKSLPNTTEYVNLHFGLMHEFIFNRLSLENMLGINLKKMDKIGPGPEANKSIMGRFFWHPSLYFNLNKFIFLGIGAHVGILSAPLENKNVDKIEMSEIKNKADILKFEYLNLSLGIELVCEPVAEYYD